MIRLLYNESSYGFLQKLHDGNLIVDVVYADPIYQNTDFSWADLCYNLLSENGIFYLQTDDSTQAEWKLYLNDLFGKENWLNTLITVQEWGGTSKRFFPRKHDYIHMYSKGKNYKFYPERIQIPKVTAGTSFDKKGTGLKTPCDVFYDLGNFSTMSKERIKLNGKNIEYQKPQKLYERLLKVCTDKNDTILDPFAGSGSLGLYCKYNDLNYIGIEIDKQRFDLASEQLGIK